VAAVSNFWLIVPISVVAAAATSSAVAVVVAVVSAGTAARCLVWKHWRQSTGRPCVGLNGTVVWMPHSEHSVRVSVRDRPAAAGPEPGRIATAERLDLQGLQRFGSFLNCLSKKNSCSPAVKINSPPQSVQVKSRSTNSIAASPVVRKGWLPEIHVVQELCRCSTSMVFPYSVRARGREVAEQVLGLSGRQVRSSGLSLRRPIESGSLIVGGFWWPSRRT
jgi:hypothetical protein